MSRYNIGDTLQGGYHVFDIKAGGMGVVYLCFQPSTKRYYAIKTVRIGEEVDAQDFLERFRDEVNNWIHISAERRHPNIVDALLYNEDERWLFLEYVDGPHLFDLTRTGPAHMQHAVSWARDIAKGMLSLHEEFKLIHRDLKPRNVLVDQAGLTAKITDLGIGKVFEEGHQLQTLVGTPGYIAPETMRGETDFRADVYSFGAVFYRMLTGQEALGKGLPTENPKIIPPSERNPRVPQVLDGIVTRCLEADPAKRFTSFRDVLAQLDGLPIALGDRDAKDAGAYRFCKTHRFHSPVASNQPDCIFCEHQRVRMEKLATAEQSVRARKVVGSDSATLVLGSAATVAGGSPAAVPTLSGPAVQATASAPAGRLPSFNTVTAPGAGGVDPTLALPTAQATGVHPGWGSTLTRRKIFVGAAAASVLIIIASVYFLGPDDDADAKQNSAGKNLPSAGTGAAGDGSKGENAASMDTTETARAGGETGGPRGDNSGASPKNGAMLAANRCIGCTGEIQGDDTYMKYFGPGVSSKVVQEYCSNCALSVCKDCDLRSKLPEASRQKCENCDKPRIKSIAPSPRNSD